jgi:hypothetical protein
MPDLGKETNTMAIARELIGLRDDPFNLLPLAEAPPPTSLGEGVRRQEEERQE